MPGAIKWCNICNSRPADGVLEMVDKQNERVPYDACKPCVDDIMAGNIDWVKWGGAEWAGW